MKQLNLRSLGRHRLCGDLVEEFEWLRELTKEIFIQYLNVKKKLFVHSPLNKSQINLDSRR